MATSKTCRRCGRETQMTRMSMLDCYDLCYPCRREEDKDGILIVSSIFKDRGYKGRNSIVFFFDHLYHYCLSCGKSFTADLIIIWRWWNW